MGAKQTISIHKVVRVRNGKAHSNGRSTNGRTRGHGRKNNR